MLDNLFYSFIRASFINNIFFENRLTFIFLLQIEYKNYQKIYIYICLLFCGETTETYEMLKETLGMIVIKHYNKNWSIYICIFFKYLFFVHTLELKTRLWKTFVLYFGCEYPKLIVVR